MLHSRARGNYFRISRANQINEIKYYLLASVAATATRQPQHNKALHPTAYSLRSFARASLLRSVFRRVSLVVKEINMPNNLNAAAVFFMSIFLFFSCSTRNSDPIGGPCTYTSTTGTATIVSLNTASNNSNNCNNNPVEVVFDFTPANPADANDATDKNRTLTVGDGKNPPLNYVLSKGLIIGSTHPCSRQNEVSGACTPIIFTFTDVDLSDYAASCF